MEYLTEYSRFFTALLVILDPFAAIPIFLALTHTYTSRERNQTALVAAFSVLMVLLSAAIFGESLLVGLGTSLASFRVGGGIVLLLMALTMLRAEPDQMRATREEKTVAENRQSVAVVPIAIPLLAGPGSISTVIIQMHRPGADQHFLFVALVIILVATVLWIILRLASKIGALLGPIGINIMNRLFGLILTAIAIEIIANGLRDLFPVLRG